MSVRSVKDFKKIHPWCVSYSAQSLGRAFSGKDRQGLAHIFLCLCDHFEPLWGKADKTAGYERVKRWHEKYPRIASQYHDADGDVPRYTIFYPIEEYQTEYFEMLTDLCRGNYSEVEIHLHHDNDTADNLRRTILDFKKLLVEKYGLLCRDKLDGEVKYGFIHGNWALDNSRADGRGCGVNNEIDVLRETGCYADFTMPSAPDETQTTKINSIYYAIDNPDKPNSHNWGKDAVKGRDNQQGLLMIQGPLMLNWQNRKWGVFPRIENSEMSSGSQVSMDRARLWIRANIHIKNAPEYIFIKLHTHGCQQRNSEYLLNGGLDKLFSYFRDYYNDGTNYRTHYVSAREMVNVIKAVEAGVTSPDIKKLKEYRLEKIGSK